MDWSSHELDDSIYYAKGRLPLLDSEVDVLPFDPLRPRSVDGMEYLLGIEQVRDVVEGLEAQLGRRASPLERHAAVSYYAEHDAFVDPKDAGS